MKTTTYVIRICDACIDNWNNVYRDHDTFGPCCWVDPESERWDSEVYNRSIRL